LASVLVEALGLEAGQVTRLVVEKKYGLAARLDIMVEQL
jgi:hypothetical protein